MQKIQEVNEDPLGDEMINFLIDIDNEEPFLDFKETLTISGEEFVETAKDIFAFANYGGGYILIGFVDKKNITQHSNTNSRNFIAQGLDSNFHIDQASFQEKFNSYSNIPLELRYKEFSTAVYSNKRFAILYIPPSTTIVTPKKDGIYTDSNQKNKIVFQSGIVLFRRGTQSVQAHKTEIEWISKRSFQSNYTLSIISGNPDKINEVLYSNLFKVIRSPRKVWVAPVKEEHFNVPSNNILLKNVLYIKRRNELISFYNF